MIILSEKRPRINKYHKIWIASKILTVNEIIKQNNYEIYPILDIDSDNKRIQYHHNYEDLLKHSGEKCEENYKKCGKLDTLGNIMCIPKEDECPINEVKVDLNIKYNEYVSKGYKVIYLDELGEDYALYYSKNSINNEIVVKLDFFNSTPKYISEENLIFDKYTFSRTSFGNSNGGGGNDRDDDWDDDRGGGYHFGGGDDGNNGIGAFIISGEKDYEDTKNYIKDCLKDSINIDKSFKHVYENLYVGNYIGFNDYSSMNKFMNINLHYLYLNSFPNLASEFFCTFCSFILFVLILCSIKRCCHKDKPNEGFNRCKTLAMKLCIIIPYLIFFISYFIYIIYHFCILYNKNKLNDLTKVEADIFLEDLIKEIKGQHPKIIFHIIVIILFSFSMTTFILAWILNIYYTSRFLKFYNNAKVVDLYDQSSI